MKQHLFGDTENTFNLLKRIFNKLLIKNSYFLNTAREVPEFGIFFCSAFSHIRTEQKFYSVNLQIQLKYGQIRFRKRLWARTVSTHWNVIWHFSYERPDWFGTCAKAVILFQSPLKMMKNALYFSLKTLFVIKIFEFLPWLFCLCKKKAW